MPCGGVGIQSVPQAFSAGSFPLSAASESLSASAAESPRRLAVFGDLVPLDLATNPAFRLETTHSAAGELVLTIVAARWVRIGYTGFDPGDAVQFILATPESIQNAVAAAHQIHGYMAGVVFFRWPTGDEVLAMQPDEVLQTAGVPVNAARESRIDIVNGHCAAVECVDVVPGKRESSLAESHSLTDSFLYRA